MQLKSNPTQDEIKSAAKALKNGHLVSFPTETVYGLGADATNEKAVGKIYMAKGRPKNHPVIVHIFSASKLKNWAREIPDYAVRLGNAYWPGPMTLILKRSSRALDFNVIGPGQ
jgi:L-threonylcarbamoyladenylate synthase